MAAGRLRSWALLVLFGGLALLSSSAMLGIFVSQGTYFFFRAPITAAPLFAVVGLSLGGLTVSVLRAGAARRGNIALGLFLMFFAAPYFWFSVLGRLISSFALALVLIVLAPVAVMAGLGLFIYGFVAKSDDERAVDDPKVRMVAGVVLIAYGFNVGIAFHAHELFVYLSGAVAAWALTLGGLGVLLYRRSEAPIATGIVLMLVAPLVWFRSFLDQENDAFSLMLFPALVVAVYGVILIVLGLDDKRGEVAG